MLNLGPMAYPCFLGDKLKDNSHGFESVCENVVHGFGLISSQSAERPPKNHLLFEDKRFCLSMPSTFFDESGKIDLLSSVKSRFQANRNFKGRTNGAFCVRYDQSTSLRKKWFSRCFSRVDEDLSCVPPNL